MKIWLINHYAVPPQYYPLARQTYFAKYLTEMGHEVTIFAASTVHNSDKNLIEDRTPYREEIVNGIHYVLIRCHGYQGNGLKRIYNICEFAWKLPGVCKHFPKPDAIVATSMPPTSCAVGVHLARKYGCRGIAEIADLWPESIVAFGVAGPNHPGVRVLRHLEKWIYKKADAVVFTMEGGYDYIVDQGWDQEIPRGKVFHINNGVDLPTFDHDRETYQLDDIDLANKEQFNIVYAGSIRKANNLGLLLDVAQRVKAPNVKFLIWGGGDDVPALSQRLEDEHITNVVFKGRVEKKFIPYITSHANLTILNYTMNQIWRYGGSQNKLFEYFAGGSPVLTNLVMGYDLIERYKSGFHVDYTDLDRAAEEISQIASMDKEEYEVYCRNARNVAVQYDFKVLTKKLLAVIEDRS